MTLAFLDLDGLKDINDALGHRTGDDLLIALAARIKDMLPPRAFCGRFDGDEFAVVMIAPDTAIRRSRDGGAGRRAVAAVLDQRSGGAGRRHRGLAHAPRDAQARDELMRRADLALRAAKKKQRGGVAHFEPAMDVEFDDRRFLEQELRRALDEDGARRALPADRLGRRQPHRRRRGAAALDPSGARRHPADACSSRSPSSPG